MIKDKFILYIIEFLLVFFLLCFLIFQQIFSKISIAIILFIMLFIIKIFFKSDKLEDRYNTKVTFILSFISLIYLAFIYIIGIYVGFYSSTVKLSFSNLKVFIIPYILIIIAIENIRKTILLKDEKKSNIILLLVTVLLDVVLTTNVHILKTGKDYFNLIGCVIFSSIANNLLYNYIIIKYRNCKAIIIFRIITLLYTYMLPIIPNINILFEAIIKIILPFIIYIILENIYSKLDKEKISITSKRREKVVTSILFIIVSLIIMLISCEFKYGMLVIASGSMTGAINKGDAIIYERGSEDIEVGDIIAFYDGDIRVIHRVIDKKQNKNTTKYYTKGDANINIDKEYREDKDIIGEVKIRIPYFGILTVMINEAFN